MTNPIGPPQWDSYVGVSIDGDIHVDTLKNLTAPQCGTPIERHLDLLADLLADVAVGEIINQDEGDD